MYHNYIEELRLTPDDILCYLRKSRADDPFLSVEEILGKHESILNEWAMKNLGATVPESNKHREVVSGETIADRPEIQKLLKRIESPKIKAILIVEVQRLSRGDLEDCGRLIKLLRYTNTLVITPPKTYDLRDEYDRDMFERELKRGNEFLEYTKKIMNRGRHLSVTQGNYIGSVPPYGYDRAYVMDGKRKSPTLSINEEQATAVRLIFDLYVKKDIGMTNIAHRLDEMGFKPPKGEHWSTAAIKSMLTNVHYIGKVKFNWRKTTVSVEDGEIVKSRPISKDGEYLICDGKHEAIISESLFYEAKEKMGKNHRAKAKTKVRNPLAGLLFCKCGRAMSYRTNRSSEQPRLLCDNQVHCRTGSCTYNEMLDIVEDALQNCIADFEYQLQNNSNESLQVHERILKNLEKKLHDLEEREIAQWEAQSNPDHSQRMPSEIFKRLNEKTLKEKEEIMESIRNVRESMPNPVEFEEKLIRFRDALAVLRDPIADAEKKNKHLKDCIERIDYDREAPQRSQSQKTYRYDPERRRTITTSPLRVGGNWMSTPIDVDIKMKV